MRAFRRKAYTLVELLIVIILIAVLASIALPKFADARDRADRAAHKADVVILRQAVDRFRADTGFYPVQLSNLWNTTAPSRGLDSTGGNKAINTSTWHGPYMTGPVITTVSPAEIPMPSGITLDPEPIDEEAIGPGGGSFSALN